MEKIIVLASNPWRFRDKDTGELREGVTVEYLPLEPVNEGSKVGYFGMKETVDILLKDKLTVVPGFYNIDFGMKQDKNRKAMLYIKDLKFVSGLEFKEVINHK